MSDERDTHFKGFANTVFEEMKPDINAIAISLVNKKYDSLELAEQHIKDILTRRAYDLARWTVENVQVYNVDTVPDLTEWPDWSQWT